MSDIGVYSSARAMRDAIRAKTISARELLELHLDRINSVNDRVNAIVSLDPDRARVEAAVADEQLARGDEIGPLHGLPMAFKDTHDVGGWLSTAGSPTRADYVPDDDELIVARARRAGADRKSTRLNSSHVSISYAVFCLKKKKYCSTLHCYKKHNELLIIEV